MSSPSPSTPPLKARAVKHLTQARQNYETYRRLKNGGQDLDWAVTVLFYTALHLVQAYFVQHAVTAFDIPQNHKERTTRIGLKLLAVYSHYRTLEDLSRSARYEPDHIPLTLADVQEYEDLDFAPIAIELRKRGISLYPLETDPERDQSPRSRPLQPGPPALRARSSRRQSAGG